MPGRTADRARRRPAGPAQETPGPGLTLEIATRFLATRPRSRWEVDQRLVRAGADEATRLETLERLTQLGFVDDLAFARWWVEQRDRHAPRGQRMIDAELRQHGIGREVIAVLREEWFAPGLSDNHAAAGDAKLDGLPQSEDERARIAVAQHLRGRPLPTDLRALQRLAMYLVRRGVAPDTARSALRVEEDGSKEGDGPDPDTT